MKSRVSIILAALPMLDATDLAAVRAAADRLLGTPQPSKPLYSHLQAVAGVKTPYASFTKSSFAKALTTGEKNFNEFIDTNWPDLNKVTRNAITIYLLTLLRDDLKARGVPQGLVSLIFSLAQMQRVFDQAFPGYRENGLCQKILAAMVRR